MTAVVIYESMFGNTERIAEAIADGLRPAFDVIVADACTMPAVDDANLIVIEGPTHAFGMSRPATREDAQRRGGFRPGAVDAGIREWLDCSPRAQRHRGGGLRHPDPHPTARRIRGPQGQPAAAAARLPDHRAPPRRSGSPAPTAP